MNHRVFARRYGHAPDQTAESQIEPGAQGWSGSRTTQASSAYGRGSESSTMNSLRASVSRPRTSSFCATEVSARLRPEHRRCNSTRQIGRMQPPEPSPGNSSLEFSVRPEHR
jgi:hypothetical protein